MKQSKTYDALKYSERGQGYADWQADGKPEYDVKGRQLDPAGWPTGNMMDGTGTGGGEANTNLVGGVAWVTLQTVDATAQIPFTITEAGDYWLQAGEQSDQNWTLSFEGEQVADGNSSSEESDPFHLEAGSGTLDVSVNEEALSGELLAQREAAGQGVSKMHYTLRKVG